MLPADAGYGTDDVRVWQASLPASEQAERGPFVLTVNYAETLLASSESSLGFTFYKPNGMLVIAIKRIAPVFAEYSFWVY
ncbi:hypothetical protein [Vreelandella hamiltonii]|uniref:Uncharacterized protein n=1 Tax=Halomonas johnsoniae TaxID=502832 RepID=A0ABQ2WQA3_9GAMM|nr:hypothetical protein [Halomonas johnsoniae]GGW65198.1 hypothetical protein GCM10007158_27530 [Halomonas johnsoniae]